MPGLRVLLFGSERMQLNRNYGITRDYIRLILLIGHGPPNSLRRYDGYKIRSNWYKSFKYTILAPAKQLSGLKPGPGVRIPPSPPTSSWSRC